MRLTAALVVVALTAAGVALWLSGAGAEVAYWAARQQRAFQDVIAAAVTKLRSGDGAALWTLIGACAAYGVVHAVGPGHGKVLIGGAGIASSGTARRLMGLALISSLAQAATAIVLVYGGFLVFEMTASRAVGTVDDLLAPASAAAVGLIGLWLAWRGLRGLVAARPVQVRDGDAPHHHHEAGRGHGHHHAHAHDHGPGCGCGHAHAPSPEAVEAMQGWRDGAAIVAGIALRPCTGAVIVLVLAWRFGVPLAGIAAVVAMGLGTAAVVVAVAAASVGVRRSALTATGRGSRAARYAAPALQIAGGAFIAAMSGAMLAASLV
ncbi:hypothetical protein H0I76_06260 [Limibaculum sp. M0105]|uniref:Nickel/cobalt efflux system n=1 Tax=Thermohalobaculum xanthum TaxID=2753746 RepID=A0A8J7M756_9RHOB|nr:hypothetical protein [Thermohalobaculum xanthum]MBK0398784.1 hypothetical protein [Thermohalobaculum xanthum]